MTKNIAVLPIRSGSKRVKGKNFITFCGVPLFSIVLAQIVASKNFELIILAVDKDVKLPDKLILDKSISVYYRDPNNSMDTSCTEDVLLELVENKCLGPTDYLFLFQATNPFLRLKYIRSAIEITKNADKDSVLTWIKSKRFNLSEIQQSNFTRQMTQGRDPIFLETGLMWGIKTKSLLQTRSRIGSNPGFVEIKNRDDFDIDEESDLQFIRSPLVEYIHNRSDIHSILERWYYTETQIILAQCKTKIAMLNTFSDNIIKSLNLITTSIQTAFKSDGKVILFGNGGSAADSQHIAAEFVSKLKNERCPLPALALTTDTSAITALGNDYGFEYIFERQVKALVKPTDVVIGITTSGTSENVIRGLNAARDLGATTIMLTASSAPIYKNIDFRLAVESSETATIQEIHIQIGHLLCALSEKEYVET
jgi:D-sedoheptulose 7-phosphate isomerase